MRPLVLLSVSVLGVSPAFADGPTATMLQQEFSSAPRTASRAVQAAGGDTSATVAAVAAPGAVPRAWSTRLAERLDVMDFGATADATTAFLAQPVAAGAAVLLFGAIAPPAVGRSVIGAGIPAGTTVASVSAAAGAVSVTLSAATTASDGAGTQIDFATHDDTPAFAAALAAAVAPGQIVVPPGRYWLTGYPGNKDGISWISQGASFTQNGGIAEQGDQSIMQQPGGAGLEIVKRMTSGTGEEGVFLPVTADPSQTSNSFQKNALHILLIQNDPSLYSFLGDATTATHDLVGVSVQAHCPAANTRCSLFGSNWVNFLDPGSDGPSTANETQIVNNRAAGVPEMDSWNNTGAVDYIMSGTSPTTNVMMIQGQSTAGIGAYNGVVFRTGAIGSRLLVERTPGAQDASGVVHSHVDTMWLGADGSIFGQSLHIGGGTAGNDVLPGTGLSVDAGGNMAAASLTVSGTAQIGGGVISTRSAAYTLTPSDCGTTIRDTGTAAHGYTVPAGLQPGCRIDVIQAGAGVVTFAAGTGEIVESLNNLVRTGGQFAKATMLVDSASSVLLSGQLQ